MSTGISGKTIAKNIGLGVLAAVLLFAIGMATRMAALRVDINYGMHAVFAALFYGALVAVYERRGITPWALGLGGIAYGAIMGMMSPVMAVAAIAPAVIYLALSLALRASQVAPTTRAVVCGCVFAACAYAGVICGGVMFGSHSFEAVDALYLLLCAALGLAGAFAGSQIAAKFDK